MRLAQVLEQLSGLAGGVWNVEAKTPDGPYSGSMSIFSVDELQMDDRIVPTGGNVILRFLARDPKGRPRGGVFWARDVVRIVWDGREMVTVEGKKISMTLKFCHSLIVGGLW